MGQAAGRRASEDEMSTPLRLAIARGVEFDYATEPDLIGMVWF